MYSLSCCSSYIKCFSSVPWLVLFLLLLCRVAALFINASLSIIYTHTVIHAGPFQGEIYSEALPAPPSLFSNSFPGLHVIHIHAKNIIIYAANECIAIPVPNYCVMIISSWLIGSNLRTTVIVLFTLYGKPALHTSASAPQFSSGF